MQLEAITPEVARQLDLPRGRGGAIVADVDRGSAAANAGVQPNDVILEVNRQPVANVSQVTRALQNATAGRPVFLLVWRDGQQYFITMTQASEGWRLAAGGWRLAAATGLAAGG